MFSRITARLIHLILFIFAAGTCACLVAELIITTRVRKDEGSNYDYSWLTYYLLSVSCAGALQSLLWISQSRLYENGRPTVQECVLTGLFSGLYLFAAAWQFYQTFANEEPNEFLCSTSSYDSMIHCRLWQSQLLGCAACGVLFFATTILWVVLFRSRPLEFKDLTEEMITSSPTTMASTLAKEDAAQREREEAAAVIAEAERRRAQQRQQQQMQQQQQIHRPIQPVQQQPQPRPTHPYQPYQQHHYQTPRVNPVNNQQPYYNHQMQHQNSSGYLNHPYQQIQSQAQQSQAVIDNEAYYNSNYALERQHRPSYEMIPTTGISYQNQSSAAVPITGGEYTEEPSNYVETPGARAPGAQYGGSQTLIDHGHNQPNINNTSNNHAEPTHEEDLASQKALAHLEYAKQLREQQLYHQNMAEALQRQKHERMLKQQQHHPENPTSGPPPVSGSTVDIYPPPPRHSATYPLPVSHTTITTTAPSSTTTAKATLGSTTAPSSSVLDQVPSSGAGGGSSNHHPYSIGAAQNFDTGMVTPDSNNSSARIKGSPQLYQSDNITVAESHYSDDRYKAELLGEIRRARQEEAEAQAGTALDGADETQSHHDYKVQVGSDYGGRRSSSNDNNRSSTNDGGYVPPPKSRTMWS